MRQVYWNYTGVVPIPTTLTPTFTTVSPNVSFPDSTPGPITTLAGPKTYFALRFVGA